MVKFHLKIIKTIWNLPWYRDKLQVSNKHQLWKIRREWSLIDHCLKWSLYHQTGCHMWYSKQSSFHSVSFHHLHMHTLLHSGMMLISIVSLNSNTNNQVHTQHLLTALIKTQNNGSILQTRLMHRCLLKQKSITLICFNWWWKPCFCLTAFWNSSWNTLMR